MAELLNINKLICPVSFFLSLLVLTFLESCAPVPVFPPNPPFSVQEIADILLNMKNQQDSVDNFFSSGRIVIQMPGSEFEANALIIGNRDPFKIKIEVTHFWGRPLVHILIDKTRLHIISFPEKRYYLGYLGDPALSNFFPARLNPDQLWAFVRGYPIPEKHDLAVSLEGDHISLLNGNGDTIQLIVCSAQNNLSFQTFFPKKEIRVSFSDFKSNNDIQYAQKIRLYDQGNERTLLLNLKRMVFNRAIPESIFKLDPPHDFKLIRDGVHLDTQ